MLGPAQAHGYRGLSEAQLRGPLLLENLIDIVPAQRDESPQQVANLLPLHCFAPISWHKTYDAFWAGQMEPKRIDTTRPITRSI